MVCVLRQSEPFETLTRISVIDRNRDFYRDVDFSEDDGLYLSERDRNHPMLSGCRINDSNVARQLCWGSETRSVPDVEIYGNILLVSSRVCDAIEALEPRVHQFIPVTFYRPSGELAGEGNWLIACNRIPSVSAHHSTYQKNGSVWVTGGNQDLRLVFDKGAISGKHLWQDPTLVPRYFCSDMLADRLQQFGVTGLARPLQRFDEI